MHAAWALRQVLCVEWGMRADPDAAEIPEGLLLTTLLERRQSHPLVFAALYRELGRSLGLPVEIVALPGYGRAHVRGQLGADLRGSAGPGQCRDPRRTHPSAGLATRRARRPTAPSPRRVADPPGTGAHSSAPEAGLGATATPAARDGRQRARSSCSSPAPWWSSGTAGCSPVRSAIASRPSPI